MDELGCDLESLKFDEACLRLRIDDESPNAWLYLLSSDCAACPYTRTRRIAANSSSSVTIDTVRSTSLRVLDAEDPSEYVSVKNTSKVICELTPNFGQFGVYELSVQNGGCDVTVVHGPTYPYTELIVILGVLVLVLFGLSSLKSLWHVCSKKCMKRQVDEATRQLAKRRVKAIDTVRGASTLMMIFVNGGSGGYKTLGHATWNGLLLGDLLFPCFIWIMGVCIPIALTSQLKRTIPKRTILYGIAKRSILLFLIGVSLNTVGAGPRLEIIRVFGVLQRFGITYFIVAACYLCFSPKRPKQVQVNSPMLRGVQDVLVLIPQWCAMAVIVAVHCAITFCLNVPGCPTGYLGPGGLHDDGKHFDCVGGAAGYIDRTILKEDHLYRPSSVYNSGPFDPEGILGTLTTTFQVFLGLHAGIIMTSYKDWKERVVRWLAWAAFFGCIGCVLHFANVIPVNKNLWSLSFVLVTTSFSLAFLTACYLLVDVVKVWNGGPFRIPGMNALLLYVGHIVCYKMFPFHWHIGNMDSRGLQLLEAIWCVALWTIIAYIMHKKRTYITL
ncbi:heparan-alpha-glucosaminide N-acetyltransferase-like [Hylaeus anthracinus]|uniref:heparan-alpha-glucosaminide N-acetyltransferase-like n=1 Tax=Hylaeus anthracinus TaxID=313031 RepID=UPI0023B9DBCE|nr:heparan-alpha-glucosaminide N-acetyltransferase-like [Hylaeus anthracinus]